MKLSVSVPDDLWAEVADTTTSPSQLVQKALRLLQLQGAQDFPTASGHYDGTVEDFVEFRDEIVAKLARQALEMRGNGYSIGIELAGGIPWKVLDALPRGADLLRQLHAWVVDQQALPDEMDTRLVQLISDYDENVDENGEIVWSDTLFEGVATAIDETRDAVCRRTHASLTATDPKEAP